ncbi:hypothetical protein ACFSQ3_10070 [Sphingobacterium corticis]|uniref:Uncharacterized protein n=1 Tax=Sphingobacterium corticis TaxID=1812823 RepID=A0ABW5NK50_9SPHI
MAFILLQASTFGSVIGLLISLAFALAIFLLFRSIFLWYWKVDKILENQQKQIDQQKTIIDGLAGLYNLLESAQSEYFKNK